MAKKPVLVVMAAGMGSRYGGLKQIDPVGSRGEAILDYSVYDAHEAGFETIVIIIKEAIKKDFMETVGARLAKAPVEIRYAYQELDKLPEGYTVPADRTKPWGTAHAVLCAKDAVDGAPFAAINADDYYGKEAFKIIYNHLANAQDGEKADFCMVGYEVSKTVTENGHVARGVCEIDEKGYLTQVVERTRIEQHENGIQFTEDGENWVDLADDTIVSMNMWGFTPKFMEAIDAGFAAFLDKALVENPLKGEYFLPFVVTTMLNAEEAAVKVLASRDKWYGVTYAADKPVVMAALKEKTAEDGENWADLADDTIVSMNMWGFTPKFMEAIDAGFAAFLDKALVENPLKGEYFLPFVVTTMLNEEKATVKVLASRDKWYGVTYAADKPVVMAALKEKTAEGLYPDGLWG